MLTSAYLASDLISIFIVMSFYHILLVSMLISQHLRSASFCQVLLLYLVKHGLGKSWLYRGPIYSGPALVFLSSSPSSFLTQQPVLLLVYWSRPLVWSVDLLLHSSSALSFCPVFIRACYIVLFVFLPLASMLVI